MPPVAVGRLIVAIALPTVAFTVSEALVKLGTRLSSTVIVKLSAAASEECALASPSTAV